jgi:hypothetical protein
MAWGDGIWPLGLLEEHQRWNQLINHVIREFRRSLARLQPQPSRNQQLRFWPVSIKHGFHSPRGSPASWMSDRPRPSIYYTISFFFENEG